MAIEFKGSNAVVLPPSNPDQQFNPSVFSQAWMIRRLQIDVENFTEEEAIQSPILFSAPTKQFTLQVIAERIQMNLPPQREEDWEAEGEMVRRIMHEALGKFPLMPYSAVGMNFNWMVNWAGHPNSEISRKLFFGQGNPLFQFFDTGDACFGVYASKDCLGTRLRAEARPITAQNSERNQLGVLFNFNFNLDLAGDDRLAQVGNLLGHWEEAKEEASRIIQRVNAECGL